MRTRRLAGLAATWVAAGILITAERLIGRDHQVGVLAGDTGRALTRIGPDDLA